MKRVVWIWGIVWIALFAQDGEAIFKAKCASCHRFYIPQRQLNENYEHNNTILKLEAPTLTELSFRLRDQIGDRKGDAESQIMEIESFLSDYLKAPDKTRTILPPHVRRVFGTMPPMQLSEEEIEALANFMYGYAEKMMIAHGVKRYTYPEALKKAKQEGKIIMIEGYLPYCRWCIRMDREVMVEDEVKRYLDAHFVLVKMNVATEKLPLGMPRLGTPSFYFIDGNGKRVIDMVEGYGDVEEFLELLRHIVSEAKK